MYKSKIVTTIKYIAFLLFLICAFQEPQEACAKYVSGQGYGADFNVYETTPDDYTRSVIEQHITKATTKVSKGAMIIYASNGKKYLLVAGGGYFSFNLEKYSGGSTFIMNFPYGKWVYEDVNGEWVLIASQNANAILDLRIPLGLTTIYMFREYINCTIYAFPIKAVLFEPSEAEIPLPTPTPTPSPTNTPIVNIDANDAGLADIFDAVMRIMSIAFCINGYEVTFLQIFVYIVLASGVLYLIFGGTRD